jgi:hypothetical protein
VVVIYRIYRITASAHYLAHYPVHHFIHLIHHPVHHLVHHHLAVASFLLMTQPAAAVAPAAIIALIRA